VARVATIKAGMSMDSVAFQVSRLCGSAQQAIVSSAQAIMLGDADFAIGGGVEVMSRGTYLLPALRSGARMGDTKAIDSMVAVLTDPFGVGHMGITAENLCTKHGITREEQDAFALESQKRAARRSPRAASSRRSSPITFEDPQGHRGVRHRRASARPRRWKRWQDEAGVQEGRHGHGRQRLGHQRCRRLR
jgi:acetyl-CoA C-acetyltransferase